MLLTSLWGDDKDSLSFSVHVISQARILGYLPDPEKVGSLLLSHQGSTHLCLHAERQREIKQDIGNGYLANGLLGDFSLPSFSLLLFPLLFECVFSIYSKFSTKNIDTLFKQKIRQWYFLSGFESVLRYSECCAMIEFQGTFPPALLPPAPHSNLEVSQTTTIYTAPSRSFP